MTTPRDPYGAPAPGGPPGGPSGGPGSGWPGQGWGSPAQQSGYIPYGTPVTQGSNGPATAALVLGILSIVTCWTVLGGLLFGVLGVVLGLVGRNRARRGPAGGAGVALSGVVTGAVGLLLTAALVVLAVTILTSDGGRRLRDCLSAAGSDSTAVTACQQQFQRDLLGR